MFALKCAVTHSAVLACEWKGRSGEEGGVGGGGIGLMSGKGGNRDGIAPRCAACQMPITP